MAQKRNIQGRPEVRITAGNVRLNVADYDGHLAIGLGPYKFDTIWEGVAANRVRAYNDGDNIVGVAVIRHQVDWPDLTADLLKNLNFSSRVRDAWVGDTIVFENVFGQFLVADIEHFEFKNEDQRILDLVLYVHGAENVAPMNDLIMGLPKKEFITEQGEFVTEDGEYIWQSAMADEGENYVTDENGVLILGQGTQMVAGGADTDISESAPKQDVTGLIRSAALELGILPTDDPPDFRLYGEISSVAALAERNLSEFFEAFDASNDGAAAHGGPGHNQPPPDVLVDEEKRSEVLASIKSLQELPRAIPLPDRAAVIASGRVLANAAISLLGWLETRLTKFADAFADTAGKTMGSRAAVIGIGLIASGQLARLTELLDRVITSWPQ